MAGVNQAMRGWIKLGVSEDSYYQNKTVFFLDKICFSGNSMS